MQIKPEDTLIMLLATYMHNARSITQPVVWRCYEWERHMGTELLKGMQPGPRTSQRACMHVGCAPIDRCMDVHALQGPAQTTYVRTQHAGQTVGMRHHACSMPIHVIMLKKKVPRPGPHSTANVNASSSVSN